MAQRFSFANALLHFARADGPSGFIWKYLLGYVLGAVVLVGIGYFLFSPLLNIWFDVFIDVTGSRSEAEMEATFTRRITEIAGWIVFSDLLMFLLGLVFWAVFEAAVQRRYVLNHGFSIRLGGDELRLLLIGLIWFFMLGIGFVFSVFLIGTSTAGIVTMLDNRQYAFLVFASAAGLVGCFWLWLTIRLAPASAMTIRDRRIRFFDAWGATRGRFWPLLGSYVLLFIVLSVTWSLAYLLIGGAVAASIAADVERVISSVEDPLKLFAALMQFNIVGPVLVAGLSIVILQGLLGYIWAGPAALAAKTDPRGGSITQAPDAFA